MRAINRRSRKSLRKRWSMLSWFSPVPALFAFMTDRGVQSIRAAQNSQQMQELAVSTLHRAELAADYAFIALAELSERSGIVCSAETLAVFRAQIHKRAIVKDIRVIGAGGDTLCSAFPEAFSGVDTKLDLATALVSRNGQIRLLPLMLDGQPAFGVLRALDPGSQPAGRRQYRHAGLRRAAQRQRGAGGAERRRDDRFLSQHDGRNAGRFPDTLSAGSGRHPLRPEIHIGAWQLAVWNDRISPAYQLGGGVLGLVFGLLAVRSIAGPHNVTADIDRALAHREFRAYAQPIFSLQDGAVTGCEILARRICRDGTVIAPHAFIPVAEQTDRIAPITWQIIDDALTGLRPFLSRNERFTVAFNIDAAHLTQPSFAADLRAHVLGARVSTR